MRTRDEARHLAGPLRTDATDATGTVDVVGDKPREIELNDMFDLERMVVVSRKGEMERTQ